MKSNLFFSISNKLLKLNWFAYIDNNSSDDVKRFLAFHMSADNSSAQCSTSFQWWMQDLSFAMILFVFFFRSRYQPQGQKLFDDFLKMFYPVNQVHVGLRQFQFEGIQNKRLKFLSSQQSISRCQCCHIVHSAVLPTVEVYCSLHRSNFQCHSE